MSMTQDTDKSQVLKILRRERKQWVAQAAAVVREQKQALRGIREYMASQPATVPQIAEGAGLPSDQVLWYLAALKKYGEVVEDGKDGDFYRYALVADAEPEPAE